VGVYPLDLEEPMTREFVRNQGIRLFPASGRAYRIRRFEVQRQLIDAEVFLGERELKQPTSTIVFDDDTLLGELRKLGVQLEDLELPYRSNYPI
jgi:hypothetical protein